MTKEEAESPPPPSSATGQHWVCQPVADPGPLDELPLAPPSCLWIRGGDGIIGWGSVATAVFTGMDRFAAAARLFAGVVTTGVCSTTGMPGTGPVLFGAFAFDAASPASVAVVPAVTLRRANGHAWITTWTGAGRTPGTSLARLLAGSQPHNGSGPSVTWDDDEPSRARWLGAVNHALEQIRSGRVDKVVLAREHTGTVHGGLDVAALVRQMAAEDRNSYAFGVAGLVGATPELLIARWGSNVESLVLAGSAARGATAEEDARLGQGLAGSPKERTEHRHAVDSVTAQLRPRCATLRISAAPALLKLTHLQHLATTVRGNLTNSTTALELVQLLHPTAAVCGTPAPAAMALIRQLEPADRGCYTGPVGWTDARGDGEWGIALRCAQLDGPRIRVHAGAGIVDGSVPEAELRETDLKFRSMLRALTGPT